MTAAFFRDVMLVSMGLLYAEQGFSNKLVIQNR
jgi:hypothetical protein